MSEQEMILERLDRIEKQLAPIAATAGSIAELRDELAPRVNEAVHALILQLADVESDFQLEDLTFLIKKLMRNTRNLSFSLDQLKNFIDFALTAEPLMKTTVPQVIFYLDALEQKGVFRLLNMGLDAFGQISSQFTEEQMKEFGDGLVRLADILKKMIAPTTLDMLERFADIPSHVDIDGSRPPGFAELIRALNDPEIKQSLGIMLELTRGMAYLKK